MVKSLIHNGVIIPEKPIYRGLTVICRGEKIVLSPLQEEMALAWVKKLGTEYVEDAVFVRNFMTDFSRALNIDPILRPEEIDFGEVIKVVAEEKAAREAMTKEERKASAAERKRKREELKEKYGYAIADGERIELANYIVEPSCIFMGRGKHPLRGRWKQGASQEDVTLNLSPDAPVPPGNWAEIVWQPENLWVAKWTDKLSDKVKYIWLHDTAPMKQAREAQKFDKANELAQQIDKVRAFIDHALQSDNPKRRKVATACYLIDKLCLRVGDEKDPDEADTVGATTLRPEHVKLLPDGTAEFRFLGKDSVLWHKKIQLPEIVRNNLLELTREARPSRSGNNKKHPVYNKPQLFPDITSRNVNAFLSEAMPGLTAKVFRTFHASTVVAKSLNQSAVTADDPEYRKWEAVVNANREAAILCNHTKKAPANWATRKEKLRLREQKLQEQLKAILQKIKNEQQRLVELRRQAGLKKKVAKTEAARQKVANMFERKFAQVQKNIQRLELREEKTRASLGKLKTQIAIASKNRTWNLGTSQKSYIDPRVFYNWGKQVDYDVLEKYYSATLRRKFMWVKESENEEVMAMQEE